MEDLCNATPKLLLASYKPVLQQGTIPNGTANGSNGNVVAPMANGVSNSAAWRQETLNNPGTTIPTQREVDPTLYEELKLGHDGAGKMDRNS